VVIVDAPCQAKGIKMIAKPSKVKYVRDEVEGVMVWSHVITQLVCIEPRSINNGPYMRDHWSRLYRHLITFVGKTPGASSRAKRVQSTDH
jgi:hypothetical protein